MWNEIAGRLLTNRKMQRFIKFCIVGGSGVLVDMGVLYLLADPGNLGLDITISKIAAVEVAIINNFLWNDSWTFSDLDHTGNTSTSKTTRFLKFNTICILGMVFSILLLNLQVHLLNVNLYLANLIAIVLVTGWNFGANHKYNWGAENGIK